MQQYENVSILRWKKIDKRILWSVLRVCACPNYGSYSEENTEGNAAAAVISRIPSARILQALLYPLYVSAQLNNSHIIHVQRSEVGNLDCRTLASPLLVTGLLFFSIAYVRFAGLGTFILSFFCCNSARITDVHNYTCNLCSKK